MDSQSLVTAFHGRDSNGSGYVGRLAPSPTGALHLGNVRTFMVAWLRARSQGGRVILRTEDLDHPKDKPGAAAQAIADLKWLGFDWDAEYVQSRRKHIYRAALESLRAPHSATASSGASAAPSLRTPRHAPCAMHRAEDARTSWCQSIVYPCVCSRRDVEAAQSAPHAGEQLFYPGTCRHRFASWAEACVAAPGRTPCWRFATPPHSVVAFDDAFAGRFEQDVSATLGDFPLAREEFGAGYTLACTVDDLLMGVTEVVRGDDLLPATPAQILLARALLPRLPGIVSRAEEIRGLQHGGERESTATLSTCQRTDLPQYLHVPLVVGADGKRLAKRHGDTRIASYREQGRTPESILGFLAASCGWVAQGESVTLAELLPSFDLTTIPKTPFVVG